MSGYNVNRRYYNPNRENRWQDWIILFISIWFFFSPWILQFGHGINTAEPNAPVHLVSGAAWNAWVVGAVIFFTALSAIGRMELWQERFVALLAVWIFIAPWVIGFASTQMGAASWDHWVVGVVVFLCTVSNIMSLRQHGGVLHAGE